MRHNIKVLLLNFISYIIFIHKIYLFAGEYCQIRRQSPYLQWGNVISRMTNRKQLEWDSDYFRAVEWLPSILMSFLMWKRMTSTRNGEASSILNWKPLWLRQRDLHLIVPISGQAVHFTLIVAPLDVCTLCIFVLCLQMLYCMLLFFSNLGYITIKFASRMLYMYYVFQNLGKFIF